MPYTAKQRRYFHAAAARGEKGMKEMAAEADAYARKGKEKPPVVAKKAAKKVAGKKPEMPMKEMPKGKNMPAWMEKAAAAKKAAAKKGVAKRTSKKEKY